MRIYLLRQACVMDVIVILLSIIYWSNAQCTSDSWPLMLTNIAQYQVAKPGDDEYAHFLVNGFATFTYGDKNASMIYELESEALLEPDDNCTAECITQLSSFYKIDGSTLKIIMLRPEDEPVYPSYTNMDVPAIYCAKSAGMCGANQPIYLYHSSEYRDYIADTQLRVNGTYTKRMSGVPLCYLWQFVEEEEEEETTTIEETTMDGWENATIEEQLDPDWYEDSWNSTVGNETAPSNETLVDGEVDAEGNKFGHRWAWILIALGCLLLISCLSGCIFCTTMKFIGAEVHPASKSPPPAYYPPSSSGVDLPPAPIESANVFTVGLASNV